MNNSYNGYSALGLKPQAVIFDIQESTEQLPYAEEFADGLKHTELKVIDAAALGRDTLAERFKVLAGQMITPVFNCVVITDREDGIRAALSVGMVVIGFWNRNTSENLNKADMILSSFEGADIRTVNEAFAHARKFPL